MASLVKAPRAFARLSSRSSQHNGARRGFQSRLRCLAAQNFTMPAMSPTMTEGNIASWKVKEGDSFATGDVLLEIETDKAQMDVEAQDDGQLAKITQPDGSKGVKVGTRIAVVADVDDDLSSLSISTEEPPNSQATSPQDEMKSGVDPSKSSESQAEAPPSSKGEDKSMSQPSSEPHQPGREPSSKPSKQTYPLYPSIAQLLHEKGIPASDVDKIPASGPKGRLLKGDVLAYLGSISKSYSSDQSTRISRLGHLDLSNVKVAPPPKQASPTPSTKAPSEAPSALEPEPDTEIAVTVSFASVLEVQRRIQKMLHITLPLSTFIARATEVANDDLPRSTSAPLSPDDLFNQVLGLDKVGSKTSRGSFIPQITALPPTPMAAVAVPQRPARQPDIIDLLTGKPSITVRSELPKPPPGIMAGSAPGTSTNVFSVSVPKGEEKRAKVFLERVKTILQVEPGRLVV